MFVTHLRNLITYIFHHREESNTGDGPVEDMSNRRHQSKNKVVIGHRNNVYGVNCKL